MLSMNHAQAVADYDAFAMYICIYGISIVFDGHKIGNEGIKSFHGRGYNVADQIEWGYMKICDLKKALHQDQKDDSIDLLTIESGRDVCEMVKKLVHDKLKVTFSSVKGITSDGKSAHSEKTDGICFIFYYFSICLFLSFATL